MLSVVIPTLNAENSLSATLSSVRSEADEIVVVDGGSTDKTRSVAETVGARVVVVPRGRGVQLAAGAAAATRDWLLFLHADTVLEDDWPAAAAAHVANDGERAAFFRLVFDEDHGAARWVAALANWRARILGLPYGDQGLLISRRLYDAVGGYRPLPLMEDVDLARRLGKARLTMLEVTARTSADRYRRDGWFARPLTNLFCLGLWFAGLPPERIVSIYR